VVPLRIREMKREKNGRVIKRRWSECSNVHRGGMLVNEDEPGH
jgi:hypothetical protein